MHPWQLVHDRELGGEADTPGGCVTIQRGQDRLEKQVNWNSKKFNKEKCKLIHLWRSSHRHQNRVRFLQQESGLVEKDLGILCMRKRLVKCAVYCVIDSG